MKCKPSLVISNLFFLNCLIFLSFTSFKIALAQTYSTTIDIQPCIDLGLDCSDTCCLEGKCADAEDECSTLNERNFIELYIGIGLLIGLMIGVPTLIYVTNFCFMYKFCKRKDAEGEVIEEGFTICEMFANCCSVCSRKKGRVAHLSERNVFSPDFSFRV